MPMYLFSILAALKAIIKQTRNIQRQFLLGGTKDIRKWPLVDWQTICTSKSLGGLGLRDPLDNNKVMSAKIWWRWVNYHEEPWAKMGHLKYAPQWPHQSLVRFEEDPARIHHLENNSGKSEVGAKTQFLGSHEWSKCKILELSSEPGTIYFMQGRHTSLTLLPSKQCDG